MHMYFWQDRVAFHSLESRYALTPSWHWILSCMEQDENVLNAHKDRMRSRSVVSADQYNNIVLWPVTQTDFHQLEQMEGVQPALVFKQLAP